VKERERERKIRMCLSICTPLSLCSHSLYRHLSKYTLSAEENVCVGVHIENEREEMLMQCVSVCVYRVNCIWGVSESNVSCPYVYE